MGVGIFIGGVLGKWCAEAGAGRAGPHSVLVFVFPTFTSGTGRQSDLPDLHC